MSTAKATGAQAGGANGSAQHRQHHDGSSTRAYTEEQKAAVIRIRRCGTTAFYDILGLESVKTTVDEAGIKKAYRKLSLLTHPDKNGYDGADEAFKMVSRAFQILSDGDKRKRFDQFGGDPDNRFASASTSSPFSGFARSPGAARGFGGPGMGSMFEEELSPEDLFRQFFGGGGPFGGPFGGGGMFDGGPGFVFNLGGGPGIRVHQFGGPRMRRRPPGGNANANQPPPSALSTLQSLLPLLILFILPILSSLFSGSSFTSNTSPSVRVPMFEVDTPKPPLTHKHVSARWNVPYYVNPADTVDKDPDAYPSSGRSKEWAALDAAAERRLARQLNIECDHEIRAREDVIQRAQGWFFADQQMLDKARSMKMKSCQRLNTLGIRR